jgi:hypothetical protein
LLTRESRVCDRASEPIVLMVPAAMAAPRGRHGVLRAGPRSRASAEQETPTAAITTFSTQ